MAFYLSLNTVDATLYLYVIVSRRFLFISVSLPEEALDTHQFRPSTFYLSALGPQVPYISCLLDELNKLNQ